MEATAWITLGGAAFTIAATIIGAAVKLTWWLSDQFADLKKTQANMLEEHEAKDQERHTDNTGRLSTMEGRIETLGALIRNRAPRRKPAARRSRKT